MSNGEENLFLKVYGDADTHIEDESAEDPFPAYLDGIDTTFAPFCPTSAKRVLKALTMAQVGPHDTLVDLGSGDGRFVTAAVSEFNAIKAMGMESDSHLITISNQLSQQVLLSAEKQARVEFIEGNLLDLPKNINFTVIVLFLLPDHTEKFQDLLTDYYKKGARIVSLVFNLNEVPELNLITSDEPDGIYVYGLP